MVHHNTVFYRLRAASEHFKIALNCNAGPVGFRPFPQFTPIHHREKQTAPRFVGASLRLRGSNALLSERCALHKR